MLTPDSKIDIPQRNSITIFSKILLKWEKKITEINSNFLPPSQKKQKTLIQKIKWTNVKLNTKEKHNLLGNLLV